MGLYCLDTWRCEILTYLVILALIGYVYGGGYTARMIQERGSSVDSSGKVVPFHWVGTAVLSLTWPITFIVMAGWAHRKALEAKRENKKLLAPARSMNKGNEGDEEG